MLKLFLALLLSSFSGESMQRREQDDSEPNKVQEAIDRIIRGFIWLKIHIVQGYRWLIRRIRRAFNPKDEEEIDGTGTDFGESGISGLSYKSKNKIDGNQDSCLAAGSSAKQPGKNRPRQGSFRNDGWQLDAKGCLVRAKPSNQTAFDLSQLPSYFGNFNFRPLENSFLKFNRHIQ